MWPAFPASDYYGGSAPSWPYQLTVSLPFHPALGSVGRGEDGTHVRFAPVDRGGHPAFPRQPRREYAVVFPRGLHLSWSIPRQSRPLDGRALLSGPYPPGLSRRALFRGFSHWFTDWLSLPVLLTGPGPSGSSDPSQSRQGCSRPSRHLPGQAALSFLKLLRQLEGGGLPPPPGQQSASWRTLPNWRV